MSDKNEKKEECFCRSEFFQKFLIVTLGSFVGVFCAISLFFALHRPCPMRYYHPMMMYGMYQNKAFSNYDCPMRKKMMKEIKEQLEEIEKEVKESK